MPMAVLAVVMLMCFAMMLFHRVDIATEEEVTLSRCGARLGSEAEIGGATCRIKKGRGEPRPCSRIHRVSDQR